VQTFLPFTDYLDSARSLDTQRLGKQRVENLQIATALLTGRGWVHHPATKAWRGLEPAFWDYHEAVVQAWTEQGYQDTTLESMRALFGEHEVALGGPVPWWVGNSAYHLAHQSNLIRKSPERYEALFPGVPGDLEYLWPSPDALGIWVVSKPGLKRIAAGEFRDPREVLAAGLLPDWNPAADLG
jgi:hypothetical protein